MDIILFIIMIVGYVGLKITQTKHQNDPEYEEKQRQRIMEHQRKLEEDAEIDRYMSVALDRDSYEAELDAEFDGVRNNYED